MKVNGRKTNSMALERKYGTMDRRLMKESLQMAKRMAKGSLNGRIDHTMRVTL